MNESRPSRRRHLILIACAASLLLVMVWSALNPRSRRSASISKSAQVGSAEGHRAPSARDGGAANTEPLSTGAAGMSGAIALDVTTTPIPPVGTRATSKLWLRSKYGNADDQLGYRPLPEGGQGEARAPQGFVITPQGELLVLDSEKKRLVWFAPDARITRTLPLDELVMPADVGIASDGTIAVMDHEGLHTKGTLLLSPEGRRKGMLPQIAGGHVRWMNVVGNDIFASVGGTIKLGETSGIPSHETPGLYDQDGRVPGHVAPDGRTVISTGIESRTDGRFFVSVIRDEPPTHLYTRQYTIPVARSLSSIPYVGADVAGTIYIVLFYDRGSTALLCLDGATGDPLGAVAIPEDDMMTGAAFRQFTINREQGGLVYHHLLEGASSFEIYDCR